MLPSSNPFTRAIPDQIKDAPLLKDSANWTPPAGKTSSPSASFNPLQSAQNQSVCSCVGSPGDRGAFCPHHQTSVVFMQRWVACWDRQSGPIAFWTGRHKDLLLNLLLHQEWTQTVKGWHFSALISARALYVSWKIYAFLWMQPLCGHWAQLFLWRCNAHTGPLRDGVHSGRFVSMGERSTALISLENSGEVRTTCRQRNIFPAYLQDDALPLRV